MLKQCLGSICLIGLFSFNAMATTVIYQWVDKNNVSHYSQQPPRGVEFKEIIVKSSNVHASTKAESNLIEENKSSLAEAFSKDTLAKCENAKANLTKLKQFSKIEATDSEGKSRILTDIEKLQQMQLAEKQIEVYCN